MKKLLIALSLLCVPTTYAHPFPAWALFWKARQEIPVKHSPIIPKVITIEVIDPVNFKELKANLIKAVKSDEIKGIILTVNCNGGKLSDFSPIHDIVKKASLKKPVIALVEGNAYSGGYMVASATNYIIVSSGSMVGNIGVILEVKRYTNSKVKGEVEADMEVTVIKAGEFKDVYHPYGSPLTEMDKEYISDFAAKLYQSFIHTVAQNRNIKVEDYKEWAEAKDFLAVEAKELGLIDSIGTLFEAEDKILEMIKERNPNTEFGNSVEQVFFPNTPAK